MVLAQEKLRFSLVFATVNRTIVTQQILLICSSSLCISSFPFYSSFENHLNLLFVRAFCFVHFIDCVLNEQMFICCFSHLIIHFLQLSWIFLPEIPWLIFHFFNICIFSLLICLCWCDFVLLVENFYLFPLEIFDFRFLTTECVIILEQFLRNVQKLVLIIITQHGRYSFVFNYPQHCVYYIYLYIFPH